MQREAFSELSYLPKDRSFKIDSIVVNPLPGNFINRRRLELIKREDRAENLRSGVQDKPGQHGKTPSPQKIQKISWAWWQVPVVPATQEAEARELLEPRRRGLQ